MTNNIDLSWTDNSSGAKQEDNFIIKRNAGATEPPDWGVVPVLDTVGQDVTTYQDVAVLDGDYWYQVTAENTAGNSGDAGDNTNKNSITVPAPSEVVILEDTFTTADRALAGWEPDVISNGNTWTGNWNIVSNQAQGLPGQESVIQGAQEFVTVSAEITQLTSDCAILSGYLNATNFVYGSVQNSNELEIWERFAGGWTSRGSTALTATVPFTLVGTLATNNEYTLSVGSESVMAQIVNLSGGTQQGLQANGAGTMRVNDFKVTELP